MIDFFLKLKSWTIFLAVITPSVFFYLIPTESLQMFGIFIFFFSLFQSFVLLFWFSAVMGFYYRYIPVEIDIELSSKHYRFDDFRFRKIIGLCWISITYGFAELNTSLGKGESSESILFASVLVFFTITYLSFLLGKIMLLSELERQPSGQELFNIMTEIMILPFSILWIQNRAQKFLNSNITAG